MAEFDVLIRGGTVIDGRRTPRFRADVAIRDGQVAAIGNLADAEAERVIDATGCNVAPGFIDLHTHYDSQVFWDPYCSTSGWHGVTTVVIGNCGFGFAPVAPEDRDRAMLTMTRNEAVPLAAMQAGMPWDWVTFPEFLDSLERTPKSMNLLALVPLNPLMAWVMGLKRAKAGALPTEAEHAEMARLLHEAMDAGAAGISAQRLGEGSAQRDYDGTPMITDLMHDETMLALAAVLGERSEGIIQYSYHDVKALIEGDLDAEKRVAAHIKEVARVCGRPVIIAGVGDGDRAFVNECVEEGLRVYGVYPASGIDGVSFTIDLAESPGAFDVVGDAWVEATVGTVEEVKAKLADPERRARMREGVLMLDLVMGGLANWVLLRAATPEYEKYDETPLGKVAEMLGYDDIVDAFCDINIAEDLKTRWHGTMSKGPDDDVEATWNADAQALIPQGMESFQKMAADPWGCPCVSDGGAHTKFLTSGHFGIHYLIHYVRRFKLLSLEEAHFKMSGLAGFYAGLPDRGVIQEGFPADLIVYDFEALGLTEKEEVHDYPAGEWRLIDRPLGLHYVLVNGEVTMDHDEQTDTASGQLLRHGRPPARSGT